MTDTAPQQTQFATDCATLTRLLKDQEGGKLLEPADEQALFSALSNVTATLPRLLGQRIRKIGREPEDIAQEALERFIKAVRAGRVDPDRSPAGYLLTVAMNVARDKERGPDTTPFEDAVPVLGTEIDQVTRMLDALASASTVRRALARASNDQMVLDVVAAWLDLAHRNGREPTSREVAVMVGISKTTVANVLARFRSLLQEEQD
ncbi:sigma-70 family RNA polymerase sigma factor [Streptomyces sp. NPDC052682]|uniref:RNA polymerase sigma factor n=1 Tax=Streptomyces sp. NPDC052682 TaxID=3154954 RepID=UPI003415D6B7